MYKALKKYFGYDSFKNGQEEIIRTVLSGRDTLALMPTGGGKSLCYQLSALLFDGLTIVVSPLIALMEDQVSALEKRGISAVFLNSSLDWDTYRLNMDLIRSGEIKLVYCAPETLLTERVQSLLAPLKVSCLTIDEAHCISEWGHDFRPDYRSISVLRTVFPQAVCLALTATATAQVRSDIKRSLRLKNCAEFIQSFNRENIFLNVVPKKTAKEGGAESQAADFIGRHRNESGIVYCFSRKQADSLALYLQRRGFQALNYHAGLSDETRSRHQQLFIEGKVKIITATLAFGMGIDKSDVRYVIHFDLPKSLEQYYQETGRAGRDGKPAEALLLYSYADTRKIRFFINEKTGKEAEAAERQLREVIDFCEESDCRRAALLAYFGERYVPLKGDPLSSCCDLCRKLPQGERDTTIPAQKLLSCIIRTGERYGISYIADILIGSRQERIVENGHRSLSTWGIGKELSKKEWIELARLLIAAGLLSKSEDYGVLSLTPKGTEKLRRREKIMLAF